MQSAESVNRRPLHAAGISISRSYTAAMAWVSLGQLSGMAREPHSAAPSGFHRHAPVVSDQHCGTGAFEEFGGDLLIDVVVLGQKN
ncbi:MAG: hypothetical protein LAQ30_14550, partial [Acidobacteriia bacterium]|nr:hypothetical protein [Terriglobia bacterium]